MKIKLKIKLINTTKQTQTHRYREQTKGYQGKEGMRGVGGASKQVYRMKRYKILQIKQ